ncbi:MAG TPA: low affinity iron permease family protein [Micrococcaceae bacterium]|jgi:low affinity Fe/Cu permease|nr:low affinity iron permease family protein [Micrococcaceae bacterium]
MSSGKESPDKQQDLFSRFTSRTSAVLGHPGVFVGAVAILVVWALSGPVLGFSDTWQLIINTGTTIVTFLMVFIIQNTQNRDNLALNLKIEAMMLQLEIANSKLYGAESNGEKNIQEQVDAIRSEAEEQCR